VHVECTDKNKCGTSSNMGNWNHIKIIQEIPEQHTGKTQNQETTENSHIWHCTHTSGSNIVKYKTLNMGNNVTHAKIVTTE
jgi:hypothetical protein